jgi:hypothetical protein
MTEKFAIIIIVPLIQKKIYHICLEHSANHHEKKEGFRGFGRYLFENLC